MELYKKNKLLRYMGVVLTAGALALTSVTGYAGNDDDDDQGESGEKTIYIMHTGDLHGDTEPHPNARDDSTGQLEGGLARAATIIKKLRKKHAGEIVWGHTGDTIQGSAVGTYTQGKAMVDIWDALGPDVFATGNWEYVYGLYRYQQLFGTNDDIEAIDPNDYSKMFMIPEDPSGNVYTGFNPDRSMKADQNGETRRWRTIAANAYYNGSDPGPGVVAKGAGEYFTDPYLVREVNGVRIGFIGCTTNRGPQVVSSRVTWGLTFSNCMGGVKFPQNKPIQWDNADSNEANRNASAENLDPDGGHNAAKASGKIVKGYATVNEIEKFTVVLRSPEGQPTTYLKKKGATAADDEYWVGEGVDIVVLMSEAGIPESLWNAETLDMPSGFRFPEIVLSSDTHERTRLPVVVTNKDGNKTVLIEEGEDGMQVGLLKLTIDDGKLEEWEWKRHDVDESVKEDKEIADLIKDAQAPFTSMAGGGDWEEGDFFMNPFNGYKLTVPFDFTMANTEIVLERNRFSYEHDTDNLKMPADIEGTLHDVFTDSFRTMTGSNVGAIRGFRYNNTIMPGPITVKDIYHSMTIGAIAASGEIPSSPEAEDVGSTGCAFAGNTGTAPTSDAYDPAKNKCHRMAWPRSLVQEMELSGNGTQRPEIPGWTGGWYFNYSGINFDLDVYAGNFSGDGKHKRKRLTNVRLVDPITGVDTTAGGIGDLPAMVSYASYWYEADWNRINRNQIVTKGQCGGTLGGSRTCADAKNMRVLVKTGDQWGDPMAWVTPEQYKGRSAAGMTVYPIDVVESFGRYVSSDGNTVDGKIDILDLTDGTVVNVEVQGLGGAITQANFAPTFPRIHLQAELTDDRDEFGFGVIQPMRGAPHGGTTLPLRMADTPDDEGHFSK